MIFYPVSWRFPKQNLSLIPEYGSSWEKNCPILPNFAMENCRWIEKRYSWFDDIQAFLKYREVWRHVDRDSHLHCRTMKKEYSLLFCSWVQSRTGKSYIRNLLLLSLPYLQDHGLLRSANFATMATWRNDFSFSILVKMLHCINS